MAKIIMLFPSKNGVSNKRYKYMMYNMKLDITEAIRDNSRKGFIKN